MGTKKDHICEFCGKVIPKGSDDAFVEFFGGRCKRRHSLGSHHGATGFFGYRRYYHRGCKVIEELVDKPDGVGFFVQRTASEVVYTFGTAEVVIPLGSWNASVRKYNEITSLCPESTALQLADRRDPA